MSKEEAATEAARRELRTILAPGDTIWTEVRYVSRSRMMRIIAPFVIRDNVPCPLWYQVGAALQLVVDDDREGVKVNGCGMDMGFELVYNLSRALYPSGFGCIGEDCPANDHVNGDRDYTPGHAHPLAGGYALRQRWL